MTEVKTTYEPFLNVSVKDGEEAVVARLEVAVRDDGELVDSWTLESSRCASKSAALNELKGLVEASGQLPKQTRATIFNQIRDAL